MSITKYPPNTVHLGGVGLEVNDMAAAVAITPGMLVEIVNSSGVCKVQPQSTAVVAARKSFAMNQSMLNRSVSTTPATDTQYAIGDLVETKVMSPGATVWAIIPSGQNIAAGDKMVSNGDGKLKKNGGSDVTLAYALESVNNTGIASDARLRVEVA